MGEQVMTDHGVEALKVVARWPGADRATLVTLATVLAGTGADAEGYAYFRDLAADQPEQVLPGALAGFFQVRAGDDIPAGVARLDDAAGRDLGLPQYYRGLALAGLAGLAADPDRAAQAVQDLEFVLAVRDQLPGQMIRAVQHALAAAYSALGRDQDAATAAARSGMSAAPRGTRLEFSGFWVSAAEGFHFGSPRIVEPAPGIKVAQGYDFGDFAFVTTDDGIVAVDAGTAAHRVEAALADAGLSAGDVRHVIVTHAHFDHVGGIGALLRPGTQVIAQAGFPAELERQHANLVPYRNFTGAGAGFGQGEPAEPAMIPADVLVAEPTSITIGGTEIVLYPTAGGETSDALMAYLPASGVLFTGDVMMPYLGAPFFAEGSPEGLLETLQLIVKLDPKTLVQGHTVLSDLFTVAAAAGLIEALTEVRADVLRGIGRGASLTQLLAENYLPDVLRDHPAAVGPFLAMRDHFVQRLHHQRTGYWQADGQGMEPIGPADRAAALDLLAGHQAEPFAAAVRALLAQRDYALALEIASAGLARHPDAAELAELRQQALYRLMERHQLQDPFRFLIYAELAGVQLGPAA
jgi:glyoxylase-like metal-dependent hydrolase (beta-lactamase superfamily II)